MQEELQLCKAFRRLCKGPNTKHGAGIDKYASNTGSGERQTLRADFGQRFGYAPAAWLANACDGARLLDAS